MDGLPEGLGHAIAHAAEAVVDGDGNLSVRYHIHGTTPEAMEAAKSALREVAAATGGQEVERGKSKGVSLSGLPFGTEACPYVPSGDAWNSKGRVDKAPLN